MREHSSVIVYLAFGGQRWVQEARYSVLTALGWLRPRHPDVRVTVYTDHPESLASLPVHVVPISPEQLKEWIGPDQYVYRVKFYALADALQRYEAPCLLLDSDTYWKRDPVPLLERIRPGVSVMDAFDGLVFRDPRHAEFAGLLRRGFPDLVIPLDGGESLTLSEENMVMWVSGVVGVHFENRKLVDLALRVLNATYPRCQFFFVEQFAFCQVLAQNTEIIAASPYVEHYWGTWTDPYFGVSKLDFYRTQIETIMREFEKLPFEQGLDLIRRTRIRPYRRPLPFRVLNRVLKLVGRGI